MNNIEKRETRYNEYNQPIGFEIKNISKRERPSREILQGNYCYLERVNPEKHLDDLFEEVYGPIGNKASFTYMMTEPFETKEALHEYLSQISKSLDPIFYTIIDKKCNKALGTMSFLRIDENNGVIEVGNIMYSDKLKQTRIATEAQYLFAKYIFDDLGYRRFEWKCDSLNEPSKKAAERLGFSYDGLFKNAVIYKNRNRDTAWYSIIDSEWTEIKNRFEKWLSPDNFDEDGKQKLSLRDC